MIQVSGNSAHLAQKRQFCQKTTNKECWKRSRVKFWPKPNIPNIAYTKSLIWNFNATGLLNICIKDWTKPFRLEKSVKNVSLEETVLSHNQNIVCSDNPGQKFGTK